MAGYCWWLVSLKLGPNPARLRPPLMVPYWGHAGYRARDRHDARCLSRGSGITLGG